MSYWQRFLSLFRSLEESSSSAPKDDYDTVHTAVLNALPKDLYINYLYPPCEETINCTFARIAEIRAWSATLEDLQVRRAYRSWLSYYEEMARKAKVELLSGRRKREQTEYERKSEEKDRRVADYEDRNPVPRPPEVIS